MKSKIVLYFSTLAVAFLSFGATSAAATAVAPDDGSLLDLARPVLDAVTHGNYWLAAALAVVVIVAAVRKHLPDAWGGKLLRSDVGGVASAFAVAFAGALATTIAAGSAMSGGIALAALKVALGAAGGFAALHKLASALVATGWYQAKAPAWLKSVVALLLSLIGSSAIKKADAAGDAAVKASPAQGVAAVTGPASEIE